MNNNHFSQIVLLSCIFLQAKILGAQLIALVQSLLTTVSPGNKMQ